MSENQPSTPTSLLRSRLDLLATLLMIVASVALMVKLFWPKPAQPARGQVAVPTQPVSLKQASLSGSDSAKVVLLEFSDFECPYCGKYAREIFPELKKDYVDTGKVRIAFRHLPLAMHQHARPAAVAAMCADSQGQFWQMHESLFAKQSELDSTGLDARARELGLDMDRFHNCVADSSQTKQIDQDLADAKGFGIQSTPMFFVGSLSGDNLKVKKTVSGARPITDFRTAIEAILADPSK